MLDRRRRPAPGARPGSAALGPGAGWLTLATVVVGGLNYLFALVLTWRLPVEGYSVFAAGQGLQLVVGSVAAAAVPWMVANALIRGDRDDRDLRRGVVWFALTVNAAQGVVAAGVVWLVALSFASGVPLLVLAASAFTMFSASTAIGYGQGFERFRLMAGLIVIEVVAKVIVGLGLVELGFGVSGALAGSLAGSVLVWGLGLALMRVDIRPSWKALRVGTLWHTATGIAAIQGVLAILFSADVVLVVIVDAPTNEAAGYQVATMIGRIPIFLSTALSMAAFPALSRRSGPAAVGGSLLGSLVGLTVPIALVLMAAPNELWARAFPTSFEQVRPFVVAAAVGGVALGVANGVSTIFQAQRRFGPCIALLVGGSLLKLAAMVGGHSLASTSGLAVGSVVGSVALALALLVLARRAWPAIEGPGFGRSLWWGVPVLPLFAISSVPVWLVGAALVGSVAARAGFVRLGVTDERDPDGRTAAVAVGNDTRRLRVLHLAFEDHRKPGSGGGSARTHEVNRRLARRHDVTVVAAKFPGSCDRVEDGVRYTHIGVELGYFGSILTYFAAIPFALRRHQADLVVEEFGPPFSSIAVPYLTRVPTVAMVQSLFAREKSRQYHLPFHLVETIGVRSHRRFIALSDDLAASLQDRNRRANVDVIGFGIEAEALHATADKRRRVVFLGRIEIHQKGLDLLRAALELCPVDDIEVVVAGDGKDADACRALFEEAGRAGSVTFVGRIEGREKFDLLASAQVMCMPSRYETFGLTALEAQACGTPVLAFDIPCLRETVSPAAGVLVPAFDVAAYAGALTELLDDPDRCRRMGADGREFATGFDWESVATRQEQVYQSVAGDA